MEGSLGQIHRALPAVAFPPWTLHQQRRPHGAILSCIDRLWIDWLPWKISGCISTGGTIGKARDAPRDSASDHVAVWHELRLKTPSLSLIHI